MRDQFKKYKFSAGDNEVLWASADTLAGTQQKYGQKMIFIGRMVEVMAQCIEEHQRSGGTYEAMERALDK